MRASIVAVLLLSLLVLAGRVQAAEPQPGDACDKENAVMRTGGPEQIPPRNLLCTSGTWQVLNIGGTSNWYGLANIPLQIQNVSNGTVVSLTQVSATNISGTMVQFNSAGVGSLAATTISTTGGGVVSGTYGYFQYVSSTAGGLFGGLLQANNISATGGVSVTGNVSAAKFIGDGSLLTNLTASGMNWYGLTNIPAQLQAVSNGTVVSLTQVSATNISGTMVQFNSAGIGSLTVNSISASGDVTVTGVISSTNIFRALGRSNAFDFNTGLQNIAGGSFWADGGGTHTNAPSNFSSGLLYQIDPLFNSATEKNKYKTQLVFDYPNNAMSYRIQSNGTWNSWKALATASDLNGGLDRIVSGTGVIKSMILNSSTGVISLTSAGTDWGYLHPSSFSYLPYLTTQGVSVTGTVSATVNSTSGNAINGQNSASNAGGILGAGNGFGVFCNQGSCGGVNAWTNTSDARLKERVAALNGTRGLATVMQLKPITFHWKDKKRDVKQGQRLGFIAQDVEKLYPELVTTDPSTTMKSLSYAELVVPLTKAVQELKTENDSLRQQLEELRREVRASRQ